MLNFATKQLDYYKKYPIYPISLHLTLHLALALYTGPLINRKDRRMGLITYHAFGLWTRANLAPTSGPMFLSFGSIIPNNTIQVHAKNNKKVANNVNDTYKLP